MKTAACLVLIATLLSAAAGHADVVRIPVGQQTGEQRQDKPTNGMTKAEVEQRFGQPDSRRGPVGEPPISSWDYGSYVVYFENDLVLHSVTKHRRQH